MSHRTSAEILIMCLLGGMFTFFGPVLGAAVLVILAAFIGVFTEYWLIVLGTILLGVVLFLPQGILGFTGEVWAQMLSIARALLVNPQLLLLDEPTEGLAPLIVRELEEQILRLKAEGISILLAEQNLKSALRLADRCYVMDRGRIPYQGTVEELNRNEEVRLKYLLV